MLCFPKHLISVIIYSFDICLYTARILLRGRLKIDCGNLAASLSSKQVKEADTLPHVYMSILFRRYTSLHCEINHESLNTTVLKGEFPQDVTQIHARSTLTMYWIVCVCHGLDGLC